MGRDFSPEEVSKLSQFRARLSDLSSWSRQLQDDYYLIRWLRARHLDLDKAELMLRTSLKWREEHRVDGILEREMDLVPERYSKMCPAGHFGEDEEGNLIIYVPLGRSHFEIGIKELGYERFFRYNIMFIELLIKMLEDLEKRLGKRGLQIIQIVDFEHYSFKQLAHAQSRQFIVDNQRLMESNYPEILKLALIINTPSIFSLAFNIVKPLMPKETLGKLEIYGGDEESWKEIIRRRFSLQKIPRRWGGLLEGSDEYCSQDLSVWPLGPISLEYFTQCKIPGDADGDWGTRVKVGARDKLKLQIWVGKKDAELRWRFQTESNDIGFQLMSPGGLELVAWSRVAAHISTQEGSINCRELGNYVVLFDNSFSYTKSKVLQYHTEVIEIEEAEQEELNC